MFEVNCCCVVLVIIDVGKEVVVVFGCVCVIVGVLGVVIFFLYKWFMQNGVGWNVLLFVFLDEFECVCEIGEMFVQQCDESIC